MNKKYFQFGSDEELQLVDEEQSHTDGKKADFSNKTKTKANYTGTDRRMEARRQKRDRRQEVRFELDKEDRRSGNDQRKGAWNKKYTI